MAEAVNEHTSLLIPATDEEFQPTRNRSSSSKVLFHPPPLRLNSDIKYAPRNVIRSIGSPEYQQETQDTTKTLGKIGKEVIQALPGVIIAVLLVLMVCVPFGLAFFPVEWTEIPIPRSIGIQMFLLTTVICQVVFTAMSEFKGPVGCMMVENIPFMHTLTVSILDQVGRDSPKALPTILVVYSLSSILVGIFFYLLGHFRMGSVVYFFPKHIIVGAVGGIGTFVVQTGVENATGKPFSWTVACIEDLVHSDEVWLWLVSLLLVVLLSLLKRVITSPFFPPLYFLMITPMFYVILWICGISSEVARANGWFFNKSQPIPFYDMWVDFQFSNVEWSVIPNQLGTLLGLITFSLMHVPINIPSLSLTTGIQVDINDELISHGYSNILGGLVGSVQNYLCYSFSALYYKCGGGGKKSGYAIAFIVGIFFFVGPNAVAYVPRAMAGCLMIHIGLDLMKEALVDTYNDLDTLEYGTVWVISLTMMLWGMNQGLALGAVLACVAFVMQSAPAGPIRGSMAGSTLRSNTWRNSKAMDLLDDLSRFIYVIQLNGHIFFGNVSKLNHYVNKVMAENPQMEYLVLDFTLVIALDSSAADRLSKIKHLCDRNGCHLAFAAIPEKYDQFRRQLMESFGEKTDGCRFYVASDLNGAIEWCEDGLLFDHSSEENRQCALTKPLHSSHEDDECAHLLQLQALCPGQPLSVLNRLLEYFQLREIEINEILWKQGQASTTAALLADGALRAEIEEEAGTTEDIGIGALLGELCLLTGEKRKCTVRATKRSVLYILTLEKFEEMTKKEPELAVLFQQVALRYLSYRLQYVGNRIWETKCLPI